MTNGDITARYSDSSCAHQRIVRSRRNGSPLSRYAPMTDVSRYVLGFISLIDETGSRALVPSLNSDRPRVTQNEQCPWRNQKSRDSAAGSCRPKYHFAKNQQSRSRVRDLKQQRRFLRDCTSRSSCAEAQQSLHHRQLPRRRILSSSPA